jgi:hypothetical protein
VAATETTTSNAILFQAAMARPDLERGDQFTRFISRSRTSRGFKSEARNHHYPQLWRLAA